VDYYQNLADQTTTSQQKKAVVVFQQTVERAVQFREAALDVAMNNFRDNLDRIIETHQNAVKTAVGVYKAGYQTAVAKARDDCNKGLGSSLVRNNFNNSLKTARQNFLNDKQALEKQNIQLYVDARGRSIQGALDNFQQALELAQNNLKLVLGK
jgi:hypothetical protein